MADATDQKQQTLAVQVHRAVKRYEKKGEAVLDGLNMSVVKGSIYGLLGASGCGKTTLLSCIVGKLGLDSGEVVVFGAKPSIRENGNRVGYMPQDVALIDEFTVIGAIFFFGRVAGLESDLIQQRFDFLSNLLDLPPDGQYIKNLSGGQKRRVSFACALIHEPEMLILDEPTVGLDPLLRSNIWEYLIKTTREMNTTIIITTHYIEEARQANRIGMMRQGILMAEKTPNELLAMYRLPTLEQVFLQLSQKQADINIRTAITASSEETNLHVQEMYDLQEIEHNKTRSESTQKLTTGNSVDSLELATSIQKDSTQNKTRRKKSKQSYNVIFSQYKALLIKNYHRLSRDIGGLFFIFFFPLFQILVFFASVGGDPKGLILGIVNEEFYTNCSQPPPGGTPLITNDLNRKNWSHYAQYIEPETIEDEGYCELSDIGCMFLQHINNSVAYKKFFSNVEDAKNAVESGELIGYLHISSNFSQNLQNRFRYGIHVDDEDLIGSSLDFQLDMGDRQSAFFLQKNIFSLYEQFAQHLTSACTFSQKLIEVPIQMNEPIYGDENENFADYMVSGLLISMIFFLQASLTSTIMLEESKGGMWDRVLIAGISPTQVILMHILTQTVVLLIQTAEVLTVTFGIFGVENRGSYILLVLHCLGQGLCGTTFGILVSVMCDRISTANYIALGSFYPYILLSGMMWPYEGMPYFVQILSKFTPATLPILSFEHIVKRAWSIDRFDVWIGFATSAIWICIYSTLAIVMSKYKRSK